MCKKITTRCFSVLFILMLVMSFVGIIPTMTTSAASVNPNDASYITSCWGIAYKNVTVYDYDKNVIGTIYAGEGFTVLGDDLIGNHEGAYMVNYSTSSGAKTGYIMWYYLDDYYTFAHNTTCAGIVTSAATVYYGRVTSNYQTVGSVSSGEIISVLAENAGMTYIEYNTTSGRKRGWCSSSAVSKKLAPYNYTIGTLPCNASAVNTHRSYSHRTVYAGPGVRYFQVGSIGTSTSSEDVYVVAEYTYNGQRWAYISYSTSGKDKSGYIQI